MVIIQSYTANLAAFLTIKSSNNKIFSVGDLARQSEIQYGYLDSHQVQSFFDTSTRSPYLYVTNSRGSKLMISEAHSHEYF